MHRGLVLAISLLVAVAGCGGDDDGGGDDDVADVADAAPSADAVASSCGQPGDVGNELGVGKYCESFGECGDTEDAPLCSVIGDATTHFCTKPCSEDDPPDECGTGATCECGDGGCGCVPDSCL